MWSTSQVESQSNSTLFSDILRVERNFTRLVAPDVTEIKKIDPKTRADGIKSYEFNRKTAGNTAG